MYDRQLRNTTTIIMATEQHIIAQLRKENAELKKRLAEQTVNFDDENFKYYWAANDGDVVFWKVPIAMMDIKHHLNSKYYTYDGNRVDQAFRDEYFGEEWGELWTAGVRTLDMDTLRELDGNPDYESSVSDSESECECEVCEEQISNEDDESSKNFNKTGDLVCGACLENWAKEEEKPAEQPATIQNTNLREVNLQGKTPFEPIPEGCCQVVRGYFSTEFTWRVPDGINLRDTETYEFGDKWGVLYISNLKTGEEIQIESYDESEGDFKRAHDLEIEDRDADDNQV